MARQLSYSRRRLLGLPVVPEHAATLHSPSRPHVAPAAKGRRMVFQPSRGPAGDVLVCLFLRGGADGLHLVAPYGDEGYYAGRPRIAVPRPDDTQAAAAERGVALDDFFALHPVLAPLHEVFRAGRLAIVHAAGSPDQTRSHFEAMATMERGVADGSVSTSGWLGRHLHAAAGASFSPLRAVAIGDVLPQSLEGTLGATAVHSLDEFRLALPATWSEGFQAALAGLYDGAEDPVAEAGHETLKLLKALDRLEPDRYQPAGGASYPEGSFGRGLRQVAQLIKADLGLEVACLDLGGWDSHIAQGPLLEGLMRDLAGGLRAFHADLGDHMERVTLVAMSEFGRRVQENGGLGTDHGRGTCFFLMGGGIHGGRVLAKWPGLAADRLEGPGDLPVTTDYRDLLAEVVARRLRNPDWARVFPDYQATFQGLCRDT
jgi:uncharacterized protein (DUF1501 family)